MQEKDLLVIALSRADSSAEGRAMGPNEILFFLSSLPLPLCSASRLRLLNAEESFSTQSELSRQFGGELRPLSKLIPKRFHSWRFFFWIAVSVVHLRLAWRNDTVLWKDMIIWTWLGFVMQHVVWGNARIPYRTSDRIPYQEQVQCACAYSN